MKMHCTLRASQISLRMALGSGRRGTQLRGCPRSFWGQSPNSPSLRLALRVRHLVPQRGLGVLPNWCLTPKTPALSATPARSCTRTMNADFVTASVARQSMQSEVMDRRASLAMTKVCVLNSGICNLLRASLCSLHFIQERITT